MSMSKVEDYVSELFKRPKLAAHLNTFSRTLFERLTVLITFSP